jgi:glycosyltransferase involved in cell wall biosynthesis
MADWWAKMGCRVAVYTSNVGVFDGVLYRYADEFSHELESDIFISWRLPSVFGLPRPNAKVTVLWCHDIYYPQDVRPEWIEKIDIIAVLSEAHKETIMSVHPFPEEKVWVTRNGIDPLRYTQKVEKKKFHYFFSSSHERGLEEIIQIWPEIKKEIPEAVLHVGYGTYTAGEMMKSRRDFEGLDQLRAFEQTLYESDGIIYHGRMNQWELARVQLECEAWLYPYQHAEKWGGLGGFVETYCITAVEAQAAGAIPITRLNGALPEVVKYCIEWKKDWTTQDVITTLKNLKYLVDPDKMQVAQEWALGQTWRSLAEQWLKHFISLRKEEEIS